MCAGVISEITAAAKPLTSLLHYLKMLVSWQQLTKQDVSMSTSHETHETHLNVTHWTNVTSKIISCCYLWEWTFLYCCIILLYFIKKNSILWYTNFTLLITWMNLMNKYWAGKSYTQRVTGWNHQIRLCKQNQIHSMSSLSFTLSVTVSRSLCTH